MGEPINTVKQGNKLTGSFDLKVNYWCLILLNFLLLYSIDFGLWLFFSYKPSKTVVFSSDLRIKGSFKKKCQK